MSGTTTVGVPVDPTHCKGCGGTLATKINTYGHVLGCGSKEGPERGPSVRPRKNVYEDGQVIAALKEAGLDERTAKKVANSLSAILLRKGGGA